ncbi:MAG: 16S rRNA U516 pseudouridylate synthase RsuA-like enzyme [Colwellia sp.]|jgi:16S rRNA U516 pseudouridylate synthase RsuA-like enzyme|tara:strand:- start:6589 stop:6750 length:162 start_codon:yes stop_codon:yes gene_type:complete
MFIEDDQVYANKKDKNRRLSDLLRTNVRDKDIINVARIDTDTHGWLFQFKINS